MVLRSMLTFFCHKFKSQLLCS